MAIKLFLPMFESRSVQEYLKEKVVSAAAVYAGEGAKRWPDLNILLSTTTNIPVTKLWRQRNLMFWKNKNSLHYYRKNIFILYFVSVFSLSMTTVIMSNYGQILSWVRRDRVCNCLFQLLASFSFYYSMQILIWLMLMHDRFHCP